MEKLNLPPFYVGQRIVAIVEKKFLVKGKIYVVIGLHKYKCGCWVVEVERIDGYETYCGICSTENDLKKGVWHDVEFFVPLEQTFRSITFEEVIKIESPLIGIN